ncbi:site-specific DNA-methyltransferase [bacterium]|nr:site-specific DNA-methyltransferase [bacterium]
MKLYFQNKLGKIYHSDLLDLTKEIKNESIDCIIADYPFSYLTKNGRKITDDKILNSFISNTADEFYRILKSYRILAIFWQPIMMYKFTHHFSNRFDVLNIICVKNIIRWSWKYLPYNYNILMLLSKGRPPKYWDRIKGLTDLWDDCNRGRLYHKEQISPIIVERILKMATKENDLVLDAFTGGGNIVLMCQEMGRRFIGCDIDVGALKITMQRLKKI